MKVTVEDGHKIEFLEALKHVVCVDRAHRHERPERKMSEHHRRRRAIQFRERPVEPAQRLRLDPRVLPLCPLARIEADETPAAVFKVMIQTSREKAVPRRT